MPWPNHARPVFDDDPAILPYAQELVYVPTTDALWMEVGEIVSGLSNFAIVDAATKALTGYIDSGGEYVSELKYDPINDCVWGVWSSAGTYQLIKWNTDGTIALNVTHPCEDGAGTQFNYGYWINESDGSLYALTCDSQQQWRIVEFSASTGGVTSTITTFGNGVNYTPPYARPVIDGNGDLWVRYILWTAFNFTGTVAGETLVHVAVSSGTKTTVVTAASPTTYTLDPIFYDSATDHLIVLKPYEPTNGSVLRVDATAKTVTSDTACPSATFRNAAWDWRYDATRNCIWSWDYNASIDTETDVIRRDPVTFSQIGTNTPVVPGYLAEQGDPSLWYYLYSYLNGNWRIVWQRPGGPVFWLVQYYAYYIDFTEVNYDWLQWLDDESTVRARLYPVNAPTPWPVPEGSTRDSTGMTTVIVNGAETDVADWPEAVYGEPEVVRPGTLIYLVSLEAVPSIFRGLNAPVVEGRSESYLKAFDGGVEFTRGEDYLSEAQLLDESPEPGEVRWYCGGPTFIRLGSTPKFDLRVISFGYTASGASFTSATLVAEAGFTGTITGAMPVGGRFVNDASTTYLDVLNDAAGPGLWFFGFNRLGAFEASQFLPPTGDPVYTFTQKNTVSMSLKPPAGSPQPLAKLTINSGETWPSSLANGAPEVSRNEMQRTPWFRTNVYDLSGGQIQFLLAESIVVNSKRRAIQSDRDWSNAQWRYVTCFSDKRHEVTVECAFDSNVLELDLNDVVMVQTEITGDLPTGRMGWAYGKLFRVVVQRFDLIAMKAEFVLWG